MHYRLRNDNFSEGNIMTEHDSNPPILDVNRLLAATQKEFHKRGLYAEKRPDFTGFIRNNSSETLVYYIVHNRGTPEEKQEPRSIEPGAYAKLAPVMNKVREIVAWEFNVQKVKNRFPQEAFEAYNDPRTIVSTHAEAVALAKERQGSAVIINEASYEKAIADLLEWNKGISPERIQTGFVASRNHSYFLRMPIDAQIHQDWGLQSAKAGYMLQMTVDGKGR